MAFRQLFSKAPAHVSRRASFKEQWKQSLAFILIPSGLTLAFMHRTKMRMEEESKNEENESVDKHLNRDIHFPEEKEKFLSTLHEMRKKIQELEDKYERSKLEIEAVKKTVDMYNKKVAEKTQSSTNNESK